MNEHYRNLAPFDAVSLDLETLGTDPGDVILSIGMVEFNIKSGRQGETFYCSFDRSEWLAKGYTYRASTLEWWSSPSLDLAREKLEINRLPMLLGLEAALRWIKTRNLINGLWSRGYMDETMLKLAIRKELEIEDPWHYRAASDARTLLSTIERVDPFADIDATFVGVPHFALDDAIHEAKLVTVAHRYLAGQAHE